MAYLLSSALMARPHNAEMLRLERAVTQPVLGRFGEVVNSRRCDRDWDTYLWLIDTILKRLAGQLSSSNYRRLLDLLRETVAAMIADLRWLQCCEADLKDLDVKVQNLSWKQSGQEALGKKLMDAIKAGPKGANTADKEAGECIFISISFQRAPFRVNQ